MKQLADVRVESVAAPAAAAFAAVEGIGGANGWYSVPLLWKLRGWMDAAVGGPGMGRARRDPVHLAAGDVVDCWRVEAVEPGRLLRLAAEMKVPGRAWLEFEVRPDADGARCTLKQSALYQPHGLAGPLYWWVLWPAHQVLFRQMVRGLARKAEALQREGGPPGARSRP